MKAPYGSLLRRTKFSIVLVAGFVLTGGAAGRPVRLLVLGDSLAAGYGLDAADGFQAQLERVLRTRGHDVTMVDGAVSGDTSAGGRARVEWAVGDGVDAAIVELGANDGLRGVDPASMEANLGAILDMLAGRHIPVLLTGMEAPPNMGAGYAGAFRAVFARLSKRSGIVFDPFFLDGVAGNASLIQADGLHPNRAGVQKEVTRLVPYVEKLLAEVPG